MLEFYVGGNVEAAISHLRRYYELTQDSDRLVDRLYGAWMLAVFLALGGRDPGDLPQRVLEGATAQGWPTGIALGLYAEALTLETSDPDRSLADSNRAVAVASEVRNATVEALARRVRIGVQKELVTAPQLAMELIAVLRQERRGRSVQSVTILSRAAEALHGAGRFDAAAVIFGWLDGRTGRTVDATKQLAVVKESVQTAVGQQWQPLITHGRSMTNDEVIDYACTELASVT